MLLVTWAVYVYRNVIPLATNTLSPADAQEGILLWIKLSVLTIAAVIIPSAAPHYGPSLDDEVRVPLLLNLYGLLTTHGTLTGCGRRSSRTCRGMVLAEDL